MWGHKLEIQWWFVNQLLGFHLLIFVIVQFFCFFLKTVLFSVGTDLKRKMSGLPHHPGEQSSKIWCL